MCGRFTITVSYEQLQDYVQQHYAIPKPPLKEGMVPNYNVAPGSHILYLTQKKKSKMKRSTALDY